MARNGKVGDLYQMRMNVRINGMNVAFPMRRQLSRDALSCSRVMIGREALEADVIRVT